MDIKLFYDMALEWKQRFEGKRITKILTIEASGIAIAAAAGLVFDVPVVFAKKRKSLNIGESFYSSRIRSYSYNKEYNVVVSKEYLKEDDELLIIDDFLANGCAIIGLLDIIEQAGAKLAGVGVAIEKGCQPGGGILRAKGVQLEPLAIVRSMNEETGEIVFSE